MKVMEIRVNRSKQKTLSLKNINQVLLTREKYFSNIIYPVFELEKNFTKIIDSAGSGIVYYF